MRTVASSSDDDAQRPRQDAGSRFGGAEALAPTAALLHAADALAGLLAPHLCLHLGGRFRLLPLLAPEPVQVHQVRV